MKMFYTREKKAMPPHLIQRRPKKEDRKLAEGKDPKAKKLTPAERRATQRVKRAAKTQFVPNTPAAKAAGKRARRGR